MFDIHVQELEWGGRTLRFETGRMARQADGAVLVTYGETTVLATVVAEHAPKPGLDFFPLTVNYQEKTYAAGKIPGGYFKREGRPTEKETLVSRLIDRPIRPLFVQGFKCETQVITTVLSHDMENDPDMVAMVAASAALTLSGIPFLGPIGAARVGLINGDFILNPTFAQVKESDLDLVVAGTADAVMMVESEAQELSEQMMLDAVMFGHRGSSRSSTRSSIWPRRPPRRRATCRKPTSPSSPPGCARSPARPARRLRDGRQGAAARARRRDQGPGGRRAHPRGAPPTRPTRCRSRRPSRRSRRRSCAATSSRPRSASTAAAVGGPPDRLRGRRPAAHPRLGAVHPRRDPGPGGDHARHRRGRAVRRLAGRHYKQNFLLHYNFPPFSVGETGRIGFTGRREIGHGKLAWRAIHPMLPAHDQFPYTIRVVSEITESNGSSSMATVCGTSLSLMDAGVPLRRPVAGIAMGLILEGERFAVLSDILGDEDHLGDMDFKVAGTEEGVTSLQMDIKVTGITEEIMRIALFQAATGVWASSARWPRR
jgi:polyribonucleotide nucleotidyltransferase